VTYSDFPKLRRDKDFDAPSFATSAKERSEGAKGDGSKEGIDLNALWQHETFKSILERAPEWTRAQAALALASTLICFSWGIGVGAGLAFAMGWHESYLIVLLLGGIFGGMSGASKLFARKKRLTK
jgi:hypothetical protein